MISRALVFLIAAMASAAPCTTATQACTEWVKLGNTGARSLIYRSYGLETRNEAITRALVLVHGASRDADSYFRTALAAAFLAGALEDTVVIAPRFASNDGPGCTDTLAANEINWRCNGNSWRSGGLAIGSDTLSSYNLADEILRKLADKGVFPNLKAIVVAGHSAGGQFATRYEMANQVHGSLGVAVSYVVANPSSYAYPDASRPEGEPKSCPAYDRWPYGLQQRSGYSGKLADGLLRKQLAERPTVYLLGQLDTLPLAGFDFSCSAMAQGANRLARGKAFGEFVNRKYGARHQVVEVPLCGHNARCMFTADTVLPILFPKR